MEFIKQVQNNLGNKVYLDSREKIYTVINSECKEYGRKFISKKVHMNMVLCSWLERSQKDSWVLLSDTDMEIIN